MRQLNKAAPTPPRSDWTVTDEANINRRNLTPGTELTITGEKGRYRFVRYVTAANGDEWIDCYGGPPNKVQKARSFNPERVKTVHRVAKTRANA